MQEIIAHLHVGSMMDYSFLGNDADKYSILGACKEPLHRRHAKLQGEDYEGYEGRSMPKDEPEYLWAERDHALYLNLIDAKTADYIPMEMIEVGLDFIESEIKDGRDVLIVCNKGESRSPSIALMYLIKMGIFNKYKYKRFEDVLNEFCGKYYPWYNPGSGMYDFTEKYWEAS